jgi:hypothetical protein
MTTPTDEAWVPTQHEVQRALKAGVIHLSVPARGTACSHNSLSVYKCPECKKAILDYERQQGREPTAPDAKWEPTRYEIDRALKAGAIIWRGKNDKTVCGHDRPLWEECPECARAILDYERKQGREPTHPEAWKADRAREIEEERGKAHKALVAALGPQAKAWYVSLITLIEAGFVYYLAAYVSQPAGIAVAAFFIITTMHNLAAIEGSRRLAVREARRDVDEWDRIHERFDGAP